jgi:hypothetical protein
MKTALATVLIFLSFSANAGEFLDKFTMGGFYVDFGVSIRNRSEGAWVSTGREPDTTRAWRGPVRGEFFALDREPSNPYADIVVGYDLNLIRHLDAYFEFAGHQSSLKTGRDMGFEYFAKTGVRWRPFR